MNRLRKIIAGIALGVTLSVTPITVFAETGLPSAPQESFPEPDHSSPNTHRYTQGDYSVLDARRYAHTVRYSRARARQLINNIKVYPAINDAKLLASVRQLIDLPYFLKNAMGEGDWQPAATTYESGAVHIKQNPVYRFDGFDCQTFVQTVMALLHAQDLSQFEKNILLTAYGAAGNPHGEYVHYFNRNNFTDGDWNPINRKLGWMTDVTAQGELAPYAQQTEATLTRQNWFSFQQKDLTHTVTVLAAANGPPMVRRFTTFYDNLSFPNFVSEVVSINYLPKEKLALLQANGSYAPNTDLLAKIPTPAVVEIVRDAKLWQINGKNIKDTIGSELTVSHLGLLYRQQFQQGEVIYQQISCQLNAAQQKICAVTPVTCHQAHCTELMFTHATDAHPDGYYWYLQKNGHYACSPTPPVHNRKLALCNRVESLPLYSYLTEYQYGSYLYMTTPSLLGIHIEKIL